MDIADSGLLELLAKLACFRILRIEHNDIASHLRVDNAVVTVDQLSENVQKVVRSIRGTSTETITALRESAQGLVSSST